MLHRHALICQACFEFSQTLLWFLLFELKRQLLVSQLQRHHRSCIFCYLTAEINKQLTWNCFFRFCSYSFFCLLNTDQCRRHVARSLLFLCEHIKSGRDDYNLLETRKKVRNFPKRVSYNRFAVPREQHHHQKPRQSGLIFWLFMYLRNKRDKKPRDRYTHAPHDDKRCYIDLGQQIRWWW